MKEINYKEMKFNPFNLIGDEWMLVTAVASWISRSRNRWPTSVVCLAVTRTRLARLVSHLSMLITPSISRKPSWYWFARSSNQSELQESGFLYQETIDQNYPQHGFHTMYVGKIEKVLVRNDEYLK